LDSIAAHKPRRKVLRARSIAGRPVAPIGLGVQMLAASTTHAIDDVVRVIHGALDAGVTLIDIADVYAPSTCWTGQGERLVGEALRQWGGDRGRLVVATKGGHVLGAHPRDVARNGSPAHLRAACESSLRALGAERIDLYQLHSVDPAVPLEESVGALRDLQREGKVGAIGLSNVGRAQIAAMLDLGADIASVQNRMSVAAPQARKSLEFCGERGVAFLAYSPLAREDAGALGAKFHVLTRIALAHGVSPQRVALAWLLALGDTVIPIPGATKLEHVLDNIAAADCILSAAEIADIDAASMATG
jgi:aryl-alcohol dehydrogenase-like predicted oxidoreductase